MAEAIHPSDAAAQSVNGSGLYCRRCTVPLPLESVVTNVPRLVTCAAPSGVPTCPVCGYVDGHAADCLHPTSMDTPALEAPDATVTRIHADAQATADAVAARHVPDGVAPSDYGDGCGYEHMSALAAAFHGRHPNSQRFHDLLEMAGRLHDMKQADYGRDDDPFANVRAASEWGIAGWVGAMVRVNDKVRRLQSFAVKGTLANESVYDSFMDIAVYALIAHVLYEDESGGREAGQ